MCFAWIHVCVPGIHSMGCVLAFDTTRVGNESVQWNLCIVVSVWGSYLSNSSPPSNPSSINTLHYASHHNTSTCLEYAARLGGPTDNWF